MLQLALQTLPLQNGGGGGGGAGIVLLIVYLAILVAVVGGMWKAFEKAGEPGWAAITPVFNVYVMIEVSGNPWWWLLLFLIPFLNIIAHFKINIDVADRFGQGLGFGLGLALLGFVFWPLLGFGDYDYRDSAVVG